MSYEQTKALAIANRSTPQLLKAMEIQKRVNNSNNQKRTFMANVGVRNTVKLLNTIKKGSFFR